MNQQHFIGQWSSEYFAIFDILIHMPSALTLFISAFSDADWLENICDMRSIGGMLSSMVVTYFLGVLINRKRFLVPVWSEYKSITKGTADIIWNQSFF
jgi:hypothetical protein